MKSFFICLLLFAFAITNAQTKIYINKNSGGTDSIALSDIKGITFKTVSTPQPAGVKILLNKGPKAGGQSNLYVLNSDGSNLTLLRSDAKVSQHAQWNSDKSKVVFISNSSTTGSGEVFLMNGDGTNVKQLTSDNAQYWNNTPMFRNSTKIWYANAQTTGWTEFTEINYDGTGKSKLTNFYAQGKSGDYVSVNNSNNKLLYYKQTSSWSPDGEIYTSNTDFTNEVQLTNNSMWDGQPKLSPDGSKIVFGRETALLSGVSNIFIMNFNGTSVQQLTNFTSTQSTNSPIWSPDGTKIVYSVYDGSQWDLWVMNSDGSAKTQITNTANENEFASDWK